MSNSRAKNIKRENRYSELHYFVVSVSVSTNPPSLQRAAIKSMLPISEKVGGIIMKWQINPILGVHGAWWL